MLRQFDYIIIGGGLAGLQLAMQVARDRFFEQKTFAIIDPLPMITGDKTWCFWEKGESYWDEVIYKSWEKGFFKSSIKHIELDLAPYRYKMMRSADFSKYARKIINSAPNIIFIEDEIIRIDKASTIAYGAKDSYSSLHIFDSRVTEKYLEKGPYTKIFQHFKGWKIKTEKPEFDPSAFTMMDFRLRYPNSTSFTYILPISTQTALVEFTFFTPYVTEEAVYDRYLKHYINETLGIKGFEITETEMGVIPMTDFPFHKESSSKITKIGTGGSWVKGSTGYAFKHSEKKVLKIINNIKEGKNPSSQLINERARKYDSIFLDVLNTRNEMGEEIFTKLYDRNTPQQIFKFLDEETSFLEEIKLMFSLYHPQFIKSFFKKIV